MDLFKTQLDRIQKQLAALSPSQKMLVASMVAIIVMTLVWWGRYAGEPDMEPLLPQSITAEELPAIEMQLESKGIPHVVSGDKILVPADRKLEAVASLMYSHALPRSAKDGFDDVLKNINPFMSVQQSSQMWNRGKELTISRVIAQFPDVSDAQVMIDPTREVRIGGGVEPSASINITMRGGSRAQQLVDAAADIVQGAQSSMPRKNIKVTVDGMPRRLKQDTDSSGGLYADDQLEMIQRSEVRLEDKIKNQLTYINGLMVSVSVKLNTTREEDNLITYDPKNVVQKEVETQTKTVETSGGTTGGGEPGTQANTGISVNQGASSSGTGATSTSNDETSKFSISVPKTESHRLTPAGDTTAEKAAVRFPLSYVAASYTRLHPDVKDPTDAQLRPLIDDEIAKIRKDVMSCTGIKLDTDIAVGTYVDPSPIAAPAPATTAGISSTLMMGGHVKDIVLGVLALASLFMVSMVMKKGAPSAAIISAAPAPSYASAGPITTPTNVLSAMGELAGEVGSGGNTLDGMELDDETVQTQQMLEQVASLVKENPNSAAAMVKRWLNRS